MNFSVLTIWLLVAHVATGMQVQNLPAAGELTRTIHMRTNSSGSGAMKKLYPFYHTSAELQEQVEDLKNNCKGATLTVETIDDPEVSIDVITLRKGKTDPLNRVFMLFGEHARELISPESGIAMLRRLCQKDKAPEDSPTAQDVLEHSMFQLVLNSNPRSREKVENGEYCTRTSPSGVDLNRNWDEHWEPDSGYGSSDTNPGPSAFSEPETKIFKALVEKYKPTTFMTIHSGTYGMYMPWAFDMEHLAKRNQDNMLNLIKNIDKDYCQCPFGAAGKEVGYSCPGTCLDWIYDKLNAPFSFAYEIYTSPENYGALQERWREKMDEDGSALLQEGSHLGHPHFTEFFSTHTSDFVQHRAFGHSARGAKSGHQTHDECFRLFNPPTQKEYKKTVDNWVTVYLLTATQTADELKKDKTLLP